MSVSVLDKEVVSREVIRSISESRRSIRSFVPDSLPEEDVREILRLTGLAPSASNVQTWRWAVVTSPAMKARLSEVMTGNNVQTAANAPINIVLYSDGQHVLDNLEQIMHPGMGAEEVAKRAAGMRERLSQMEPAQLADWARVQTFIALGQIVLIARGMGYDSATMGGFREDGVKALLGLPDSARVTSVIAMGKRAEDGFSHHRYKVEDISRWY